MNKKTNRFATEKLNLFFDAVLASDDAIERLLDGVDGPLLDWDEAIGLANTATDDGIDFGGEHDRDLKEAISAALPPMSDDEVERALDRIQYEPLELDRAEVLAALAMELDAECRDEADHALKEIILSALPPTADDAIEQALDQPQRGPLESDHAEVLADLAAGPPAACQDGNDLILKELVLAALPSISDDKIERTLDRVQGKLLGFDQAELFAMRAIRNASVPFDRNDHRSNASTDNCGRLHPVACVFEPSYLAMQVYCSDANVDAVWVCASAVHAASLGSSLTTYADMHGVLRQEPGRLSESAVVVPVAGHAPQRLALDVPARILAPADAVGGVVPVGLNDEYIRWLNAFYDLVPVADRLREALPADTRFGRATMSRMNLLAEGAPACSGGTSADYELHVSYNYNANAGRPNVMAGWNGYFATSVPRHDVLGDCVFARAPSILECVGAGAYLELGHDNVEESLSSRCVDIASSERLPWRFLGRSGDKTMMGKDVITPFPHKSDAKWTVGLNKEQVSWRIAHVCGAALVHAICAEHGLLVCAFLGAGRAGEDPVERQLSPALVDGAKLLLERGGRVQNSAAEIALRDYVTAGSLIHGAGSSPLGPLFPLILSEAHRHQAGAFDEVVAQREHLVACRLGNLDPQLKIVTALRGDVAAHLRRTIDASEYSMSVLCPEVGGARPGVISARRMLLSFVCSGNEDAGVCATAVPSDSARLAEAGAQLDASWEGFPRLDARAFGGGKARSCLAENLRKAISAYEAALTICTRDAHPVAWAMLQDSLGNAWRDLPTGDRTENLCRAVSAFEAALTVYSRVAHPARWAATQNNLGNARINVPMGNRAENLRKAIAALEAALAIRTRERHPFGWAATQNNLGVAWGELPTGDRAENLRKAIVAFGAALSVRTREDCPVDWAVTQNNLGVAWGELQTGDLAENLRKAIAAYEAALAVRTREAHPVDWAITQNNLGVACGALQTGDRAENLCRAIAAFEAALAIRTREVHPVDWAMTQNNLGVAWRNLSVGDRPGDLRKTIAAYEAALSIYARETDFAVTPDGPRAARPSPRRSGRTESLHNSISAFQAALTVYTREAHPAGWAMAHGNLATTLSWLAELEPASRCELLYQAVASGKAALTVYTVTAFPRECANVRKNLEIHWQAYERELAAQRKRHSMRSLASSRRAMRRSLPGPVPADW